MIMNNFYRNHSAMEGRLLGGFRLLFLVTALLGLMLLSVPGNSQETKAPAPQSAKPAAANPLPRKILQQACDFLKAAKQFSFQAEVTDDRVYSGGKKLQFAFDLVAYTQRPNKLRINAAGDLENKEFFFNGKTVTLYDKSRHVYAIMKAPATIAATMDQAAKEYGLRVALADLTGENAYALMTKGVKHALYVGEGLVRGVKCHHLAFDKANIQWQVWIEAGDKPLIRKLLITQKKLLASPQWTAYLKDWNFAPQLSDSLFDFTPPAGAKQIKFISLKEAAATQKKGAPKPKRTKKAKGGAP